MYIFFNRSFFFNKIKTDIEQLPSEAKCNFNQILNKYEVESMLTLIESAINKNNLYIAKKYMNEFKFEVNILNNCCMPIQLYKIIYYYIINCN